MKAFLMLDSNNAVIGDPLPFRPKAGRSIQINLDATQNKESAKVESDIFTCSIGDEDISSITRLIIFWELPYIDRLKAIKTFLKTGEIEFVVN